MAAGFWPDFGGVFGQITSEVDIGRRDAVQANGTYVGYGYLGSANSQNKAIDEYTLGASQTLWKNRTHGALQIMGQMSYVDRMPWYVATGAPTKADTTMVFVDLRYIFP